MGAQTGSDLEKTLADQGESIATLSEEIQALKVGIVALDKQVGDATAQRQAEAAEHKDLIQGNTAAKGLILFAKNRLNKFYNPALYKPAPKRRLSEDDQIYENQGGDIPIAAAAYTKKAGGSNGVIAMMDLLVQDLDKEMQVAATEETNAQKEYEQLISDAAEKRRQDSKSLTDKE